jgi:peroxiredoxin
VFCRRFVAQLRPLAHENIVFVSMADPAEAEEFKAKILSPHRFVCDPGARLYEAFGLGRGKIGEMLNLRTLAQGAAATFQGHGMGRPVGDPWRMPGVFVIDRGGRIAWSHRSRDASDNPPVAAVVAALEKARSGG